VGQQQPLGVGARTEGQLPHTEERLQPHTEAVQQQRTGVVQQQRTGGRPLRSGAESAAAEQTVQVTGSGDWAGPADDGHMQHHRAVFQVANHVFAGREHDSL
jgi:hypothetical protein